jgi:hypothetical protein
MLQLPLPSLFLDLNKMRVSSNDKYSVHMITDVH